MYTISFRLLPDFTDQSGMHRRLTLRDRIRGSGNARAKYSVHCLTRHFVSDLARIPRCKFKGQRNSRRYRV